MAAVLSALAPYVLQMIKDIPEQELRMLLGVSGEIDKLEDKVGNMEAYLADAEKRRIDDARVQRWVTKLKGALYEATDVLELCQQHAEDRRQKQRAPGGGCWAAMEKKAPGCLRPLLFCLRNPSFAHAMGGRIKELNASLDAIRKEMADFRFLELDAYQLRARPSDATPHSRTTVSLLVESAVVGDAIEADANALVRELLLSAKETPPLPTTTIKVVSITGAGGMGKTTLAKKIFNDKDIQGAFVSRIWLSVTESYSAEKLLSSAITQAGGSGNMNHPAGRGGEDQQVLTQILASTLSSGRFLLVMDDVWSNRPWSDVLQSPVLEAGRTQPGSRVIVTTRNEHLVKDMGAAYYLHHVKPLRDEDAWSLLKKQLPVQDVGSENALDRLKHIGVGIIRKCEGLPLAIKAVGGLLRTKGTDQREWEGVLESSAWSTDKTHDDLNSALLLSYEDLSPQLKQCFLYYSLFPKRLPLHCDTVIGMWMSEGFLKVVPPSDDEGRCWKEVEDIGMDKYRDLMTRNLIEGDDLVADRSMSKMHDVVRFFAQYMAKEEALVVRPGRAAPLLSPTKIRRLAIESIDSESESEVLPDWNSITEKQGMLRSLIISGRIRWDPSASDEPSLSRFSSLRALFVQHAESDKLVESLGKLKHLRFLHLSSTDISRLPDDIDKVRFLEHIHIGKCASFDGQIPRSILRLQHLRYLAIGGEDTRFTVPKGFGGLTNLRTLRGFPAQVDGDQWCSLQELGPLTRLREIYLGNLEAVPASGSLAAKAKIRDKEQLRILYLWCYKEKEMHAGGFDEVPVLEKDCQRVEEVFDQLCPPPRLKGLKIVNYIGRRVPCWMCMPSASAMVDLNSLTLTGVPFCTQLPDSLRLLPSLEILIIDSATSIRRVGHEFQRRQTGTTAGNLPASFPSLWYLRFKGLPEWEEWEWDDEEEDSIIAMRALRELHVGRCKLERLPAGLASSRRLALRELALFDISGMAAVEGFPSVVDLDIRRCPGLRAIRGFPMLRCVFIMCCPALEVLDVAPALDTMELADPTMEKFPEYLRTINPRIVRVLGCHQKLHDLLSDDDSDEFRAEMDKIKHLPKVVVR